jgi:hypothetical protein
MSTETKPLPKTTEELADSIRQFHQSLDAERFSYLLSDFLTAGKLELAIELLKLKELHNISGSIDKIAVEGIELVPHQFDRLMEAFAQHS